MTNRLPQPYGQTPNSDDSERLALGESPSKGQSRSSRILAIVAVCCVVFLIAFYFFALTQMSDPVPPARIELMNPTVEQRSIDGQIRWDTIIHISRLVPDDARFLWTEILIVIRSSDGDVLNIQTRPQEDIGRYDDATDGTIDVEFWFIKVFWVDHLRAGDVIKITGMNSTYEGAIIEVVYQRYRIDHITLPTNFP